MACGCGKFQSIMIAIRLAMFVLFGLFTSYEGGTGHLKAFGMSLEVQVMIFVGVCFLTTFLMTFIRRYGWGAHASLCSCPRCRLTGLDLMLIMMESGMRRSSRSNCNFRAAIYLSDFEVALRTFNRQRSSSIRWHCRHPWAFCP